MAKFNVVVPVEADTLQEAEKQAAEMLGFDDNYGPEFEYEVVPVTEGVEAHVRHTDSGIPYIETKFNGIGVAMVPQGNNGPLIVNIEPLTDDEVVAKLVTHGRDEVSTLRFNEK